MHGNYWTCITQAVCLQIWKLPTAPSAAAQAAAAEATAVEAAEAVDAATETAVCCPGYKIYHHSVHPPST